MMAGVADRPGCPPLMAGVAQPGGPPLMAGVAPAPGARR